MKYRLYTHYTKHYKNEAFYELTGLYNTLEEAVKEAARKHRRDDVQMVQIVHGEENVGQFGFVEAGTREVRL